MGISYSKNAILESTFLGPCPSPSGEVSTEKRKSLDFVQILDSSHRWSSSQLFPLRLCLWGYINSPILFKLVQMVLQSLIALTLFLCVLSTTLHSFKWGYCSQTGVTSGEGGYFSTALFECSHLHSSISPSFSFLIESGYSDTMYDTYWDLFSKVPSMMCGIWELPIKCKFSSFAFLTC